MNLALATGTLIVSAVLGLPAQAQPSDCNAPAASPSVTVALPASPFAATSTSDGCWVFVSLIGVNLHGVAVLKRQRGRIELSRVVRLESPPQAMVLTHDGKLLIAPAWDQEIFLDVQKLEAGNAGSILGAFPEKGSGSGYANVTPDDKLLFISEESGRSIIVIDLERARADGYKTDAVVGKIPTGNGAIALSFSPDGRWLYSTIGRVPPEWHWPRACKAQNKSAGTPLVDPEGAVIVVDVARARTDPTHAVVGRIPAGCHPVRAAISPTGDRLYVTARNGNEVLAFSTEKLVSDPEHARVGMAHVGEAPVPVAVIDDGRRIVVGNSNRFANLRSPQTLTVLDAKKLEKGVDAVLGVMPAGAFPRGLSLSHDGRTLFLTNSGSSSLQVIDVAHMPLTLTSSNHASTR
jgi:DNA-binding beta-propeller fold protein YncE